MENSIQVDDPIALPKISIADIAKWSCDAADNGLDGPLHFMARLSEERPGLLWYITEKVKPEARAEILLLLGFLNHALVREDVIGVSKEA